VNTDASTKADGRSPIKVLYLIGTLETGGTERQLVGLATGLDRDRYLPIVCCLSRGGPLERDLVAHGIHVEIVGLRLRDGLRGFMGLIRLIRFMARQRPTIAHGFLYLPYVLGVFVARLVGCPVFVASRRSLGNYKEGRWHFLLAERVANRFTDLIVANSDAVRRDVLRQEKPQAQKVIVVHNGVRLTVPSDERRRTTRQGLRLGEAPTVGVVANLIPYKGHSVFVHAWRRVADELPDAVAILVGEGKARSELEHLVRELGLSKSIRFLGSRTDVADLLEAIDLLVHPSFQEGFSNAILEAMAAAKAVVATDVGGNPEAVIDGVTGLLVRPGDAGALASAISSLIKDPVRRESFGAAGRERAREHFGWSTMVRRYEAVYDELLASRSGDPDTALVESH